MALYEDEWAPSCSKTRHKKDAPIDWQDSCAKIQRGCELGCCTKRLLSLLYSRHPLHRVKNCSEWKLRSQVWVCQSSPLDLAVIPLDHLPLSCTLSPPVPEAALVLTLTLQGWRLFRGNLLAQAPHFQYRHGLDRAIF